MTSRSRSEAWIRPRTLYEWALFLGRCGQLWKEDADHSRLYDLAMRNRSLTLEAAMQRVLRRDPDGRVAPREAALRAKEKIIGPDDIEWE